jgi:hypothetical protein
MKKKLRDIYFSLPPPKRPSPPLASLEKRGISESSHSSTSSVFSDSTNSPDAPVLETPTMDDGGNQGQKRKRVRSVEQRLKINKAAREKGKG